MAFTSRCTAAAIQDQSTGVSRSSSTRWLSCASLPGCAQDAVCSLLTAAWHVEPAMKHLAAFKSTGVLTAGVAVAMPLHGSSTSQPTRQVRCMRCVLSNEATQGSDTSSAQACHACHARALRLTNSVVEVDGLVVGQLVPQLVSDALARLALKRPGDLSTCSRRRRVRCSMQAMRRIPTWQCQGCFAGMPGR